MAKIFKLEEAPKFFFPDGKAYRIMLDITETGATRIGGLIGVMPAGSTGVGYHYHDERESVLFFISGEGKALIEGKEYDIVPNTVMFVPPKERHTVMNTGKSDLKYVEFFTNPPMRSDFKEAPR